MVKYFHKTILDTDEIIKIAKQFNEYNNFFTDVTRKAPGTFTIQKILETIEESLNYLEIFGPVIRAWIEDYLDKYRGELWLYYGLEKGNYLCDYWKIKETRWEKLKQEWPFLFDRESPKYKDMLIDLRGAQDEIIRQRNRDDTPNPDYTPFHPNGCPSHGCSCFMLDDMEQWHNESQKEIKESNNIFFNASLQENFFEIAKTDLESLKSQWSTWRPKKYYEEKHFESTPKVFIGKSPIQIVTSWIKSDFQYPIFGIFKYSDCFQAVWERIDLLEPFVKCQREKLKNILEII
jgi:hypothetical protein